jgi:hypothetical protein
MGQLVALIWCSWVVGFEREREDGEAKRGEKKKMNKKIKEEKRKNNIEKKKMVWFLNFF